MVHETRWSIRHRIYWTWPAMGRVSRTRCSTATPLAPSSEYNQQGQAHGRHWGPRNGASSQPIGYRHITAYGGVR